MSNSSLSKAFDSIDTPADLAAANQEVQTPLARAMEAMEEVGFQGSMIMVFWLLRNMADFHKDFALDKAEGRQQTAAWAFDHGKISAAMDILRTIDIGLDDNTEDEQTEEA